MKWILTVCVLSVLVLGCKDEVDTEPVLTTIVLSAPTSTFIIGSVSGVQIKASAFDQQKKPFSNPELTWSSSDLAVGTVDGAGLVSILGIGQTTITAASGPVSNTLLITVLPEPTLEDIIQMEVNNNAIPSLAAAIIKDGQVVWTGSFGKHDQANQTPTSSETLFFPSSIAKLIVAVAAMQQVEQGALDLDADVSTYLGYTLRNPFFPAIPITARLLMTHRAGLSNPDSSSPDIAQFYSDTTITLTSWVQHYLVPGEEKYDANLWKNIEPGTIHTNSNVGITLVAHLVERLTGQDFRDYCQDQIFTKLNMSNTRYEMNIPGSFDDLLLADIFLSDGSMLPDYFDGPLYPMALVRTSVNDWSKFMIAILNGGIYEGTRVLDEATVDIMLEVQFPNAGLAFDAGIALIWRAHGSQKQWLGHTGGGAASSVTDLHRSSKTAVIIFSNAPGRLTAFPGGAIYNLLHERALQ